MKHNDTRNQHFVSQVEQKLNAMNPSAQSGNHRIYSFRVASREPPRLIAEDKKGRAIGSNLALQDLFSFDVPGGGPLRRNFEALFNKYEGKIEAYTQSLLRKLEHGGDIKSELFGLFAAKLLNFVRNPFCIEKVLNTFPMLHPMEPKDPTQLSTFQLIVTGQKPHQKHLCDTLGISPSMYIAWLRVMFMLLAELKPGQPTLFDGLIKTLFESHDTYAAVYVWTYDHDTCLLSDRGHCQTLPNGQHMSMAFNLCSTAFIEYVFADPAALLHGSATPEFLAYALENRKRLPPSVDVRRVRNDRPALARYNRNVVLQAHERVYSASKQPHVFTA